MTAFRFSDTTTIPQGVLRCRLADEQGEAVVVATVGQADVGAKPKRMRSLSRIRPDRCPLMKPFPWCREPGPLTFVMALSMGYMFYGMQLLR